MSRVCVCVCVCVCARACVRVCVCVCVLFRGVRGQCIRSHLDVVVSVNTPCGVACERDELLELSGELRSDIVWSNLCDGARK